MNKKIFIAAILVLCMLPGQFSTAPQVARAAACDAAQFVADVTVPDGSAYSPNAAFTKTWRLRNVGSCTWTSNYKLVFVSGAQMGGPGEMALGNTVAPNMALDLSVNLTAPVPPGTYRGYWQLKNASGVAFGIGATADKPFWVDIMTRPGSAVTPVPVGESYNFATQGSQAQSWMSGAGLLSFQGADGDARGFAQKLDSVVPETGTTINLPTLLTVPQNKTDGYIQGLYPSLAVQNGDHFQATIGCQYGATACYVTYRLDARTSTGTRTLWTFKEKYEGLMYNVDVDLSSLAGRNVEFFLLVLASGPATGDRALWVNPRIEKAFVPPPPSPTPRVVDASIDLDMPGTVVCGTPNPLGIRATITTLMATTVTYHWEMVDTRTVVTPDQTLAFSSAGTQAVNPGPYSVDCGTNFTARIVVTSPVYWSAMIYYFIRPTATPTPTPTPPAPGAVTQVSATIVPNPFANCATYTTLGMTGTITTDGPATVTYHWENGSGGVTTGTSDDATLVFSSAGTQSVAPDNFTVTCGSNFTRLVVTAPNSMSGQADVTLNKTDLLPIYDFDTFQAIGAISCSDEANLSWTAEACNGESGGCMISQTPLFGKSRAGFLRYQGNDICALKLP